MTVHGGPKVVDNNLISCSDPASRNSYYTGDDNVSLLLNFDGPNGSRDFVDSSKYNHVITANGDAKISTAQSKFGGASAYFDGNGDNLRITASSALGFGAGDFTIEFWFYCTSLGTTTRPVAYYIGATNTMTLNVDSTRLRWYDGATNFYSDPDIITTEIWYHIVLARSGSTGRFFVNGENVGTFSNTRNIASPTDVYVITNPSFSTSVPCYIDDLRITKGQALYTSNFTPPTASFKSSNIVYNLTPNVESSNDNVSLLLNFDGPNGSTNFVDSSNYNHTITANGNAQISTAQSKFGGSSATFDGNDSVVVGTTSDFIYLHDKTVDYTIEMWLYKGSGTGRRAILSSDSFSDGIGVLLEHNGNNMDFNIYRGVGGSFTSLSAASALSDNQWYHVAITNDSNTLRAFVDGMQVATTAWSLAGSTLSSSTVLTVGDNLQANAYLGGLQGYIDDLIITKGVAKYTNNFQVPSSPATRVPMESLRLRFDGENGSTTFRDLSPYNHTITANGNAQISTAQSKFGGTSVAFDGTGDYLTVPSNAAFAMGTGDFTVEAWVYFTSTANFPTIIDTRANTSSTSGFNLGLSAAKVQIFTTSQFAIGVTSLIANTWYHVSICRIGSTLKIFLNGTEEVAVSDSTNWSDQTLVIGATPDLVNLMTGYIDDLRIIKGRALYTSNFTPPTAPVEPYLSSSLLLNFNGENGSTTFTDESPYAHTITANGNAQISTAQSKFGGSSAYFDGTGDYLSIADSDNWHFGTGDFTVEAWIRLSTLSGQQTIVSQYLAVGNQRGWLFDVFNNSGTMKLRFSATPDGGNTISSFRQETITPSINQWHHVAVCRESGLQRMFFDGVELGTANDASFSFFNASRPLLVGAIEASGPGEFFNGYIDSLRVVKGRALYTGNFTPPQKQQKLITNKDVRNISLYDDVSLQLNFDGENGSTTFVDSSFNNHTITVNGNAQISTAQSKFGGASAAFDGNGDWLSINGEGFNLPGDFTVEMWFYYSSNTIQYVCGKWGTGSTLAWLVVVNEPVNTGNIIFATGNNGAFAGSFSAAPNLQLNTWYHIAFTRSGTDARIFVNGEQVGTTSTVTANLTSSNIDFRIGQAQNIRYVNGYIDDLRIIKGRALYTKNFTPPTRALRNSTIYESSNKGIISCDHNNYLEIEQILNPISIDFWFKTFNTDDAAIIYAGDDSYDSTQWQWALYYYNDTLYYQPSSQSSEAIEISSVSIDTWYNIVLTRGTSGKVYINGVLVDSNSCSDSLVAGHTRIGKSGNNYWNGIFGPLKMYDYELSSSEARDNFNALKGRFGL